MDGNVNNLFGFFLLQEVLVWLTALQKELGGEVSDERMRDYIWNTLKSGRVKIKPKHSHSAMTLFASTSS